jgi:DNA-binding response OmpR family regulator
MTALRKILLIEDEPVVSQVVTWCLEDWLGTEVDLAPNGAVAFEKIRHGGYALAIIDGRIPGASGLQLAELAVEKEIPVLLTTGHPEMAARLDDAGFPYLFKPFALDILLLKLKATVAASEENILQVRASLQVIKAQAEASKTL